MEINDKQREIYNQLDYKSTAALKRSKKKLEQFLLENQDNLDEATTQYYKDAINEANNNIKIGLTYKNGIIGAKM